MATMNDVAKRAGVSRATVSIVVNGHQKERNIPAETCAKVQEAIRELQYHPNVNARRIHETETVPLIALYLADDYRINYLTRFMNGMLDHISRENIRCEVTVRKFRSGHLAEELEPLRHGNINGAIFAAVSDQDLQDLEQAELILPVVLINRESEQFTTMADDNDAVAAVLTEMLEDYTENETAVLKAVPASGNGARISTFLQKMKEQGKEIPEEMIIGSDNSMAGGYEAVPLFMKLKEKPKVLVCDCDYMALGFISGCMEKGIRIPEDLKILAVGLLEDQFTAYACIPLTTVYLPAEEIAASSVDYMMRVLNDVHAGPEHFCFKPTVHRRKSF